MNSKKSVIIVIIAFAAVLIAAGIIYGALSKKEANDRLSTTPQQTEPQSTSAAEPEPQSTDERPSEPQSTEAQNEDDTIPAPDFTMLDANGDTVSLSDYFGQPIVLNFWASWCGPCQDEMPEFDAVAKETGDEVMFIMVNLTDGRMETVEHASKFIADNGYTFPVFFDTLSEGAAAYSVRSIPASYFIDSDGRVVTYAAGAIDGETLRQAIDMIK